MAKSFIHACLLSAGRRKTRSCAQARSERLKRCRIKRESDAASSPVRPLRRFVSQRCWRDSCAGQIPHDCPSTRAKAPVRRGHGYVVRSRHDRKLSGPRRRSAPQSRSSPPSIEPPDPDDLLATRELPQLPPRDVGDSKGVLPGRAGIDLNVVRAKRGLRFRKVLLHPGFAEIVFRRDQSQEGRTILFHHHLAPA